MNKNEIKGIDLMPKTITLRLSDTDYAAFAAYAKAENRNLANAIETLALKQLEETLFADALEMEEILSRKDLLKRIQTGIEQAKKGRGTFVD